MCIKKGVAVVGYGGMGAWHTRHILKSDVVELKGIWDIAEARRVAAVENGIHVYSSFEDLFSRSISIERLILSLASSDILIISLLMLPTATGGVDNKRLSMYLNLYSSLSSSTCLSGIILHTSFTTKCETGNKIAVVQRLNKVWKIAIC